MQRRIRTTAAVAVLLGVAGLLAAPAGAQPWREDPLAIVVPQDHPAGACAARCRTTRSPLRAAGGGRLRPPALRQRRRAVRAARAGGRRPQVEQFLDLNAHAGGLTIDWEHQPERSVADPAALERAYLGGRVTHGGELDRVAIVEYRGTSNYEIHTDVHSQVIRARLDAAKGHHDNQVYWNSTCPLVPCEPITAASTAPDLDWVVRLTDVHPDGRSEWVTDANLRASLRAVDEERALRNADGEVVRPWQNFATPEPVPPGEPVTYEIAVVPTALVLAEGHRLRVDVLPVANSGPDAPAVGAGAVTVHRGGEQPPASSCR